MTTKSYFSKIFGNSPVAPLQRHIDKVISCVEHLVPYFKATFANDWPLAIQVQDELVQLEGEADQLKSELILKLPTGLLMPVDRRDILETLDSQDIIANLAKDISGLVLGRKLTVPSDIQQLYLVFLDRCIDAAKLAKKAINELDELVVTGFQGDEATRVQEMIKTLHEIETETDKIQIKLRAEFYKIEDSMSAVDVIFIYKIIEMTGLIANAAQGIANKLQLMLAK